MSTYDENEINTRVSDKPRMTDYNCELMFTRMVRSCLASFIQEYGRQRYRDQTARYFARDAYRDVLEGIRINESARQCPGFLEWVENNRTRCEDIIARAIEEKRD